MIAAIIAGLALFSPIREVRLHSLAPAVTRAQDGGFGVGAESGDVCVYSPELKVVASFHERGPVRALAFSPDRKWIATGFRDDGRNVTTAIWTRRGKLVRYFDSLAVPPVKPDSFNAGFAYKSTSRLAWSPDSKLLAAEHDGHLDAGVRIWDLTGKLVAELGRVVMANERIPMAAGVKGLNFSPDGSRIVTSMDDGYVRSWSLDGMCKWQTPVSDQSGVSDAGFTPKGTEVVFSTASDKGRVGALDAKSGKKLWAVDLESSVRAVCGLTEDEILATVDSTLRVGTSRGFSVFRTLDGSISHIAVLADRSAMVVSTSRPKVYLIRLR
jgi:WD40 repeat protein